MNWKRVTIEAINICFIALWGYAAFSKLFEYEQFTAQLKLSPLLLHSAGVVAIGLPTVEIVLALMLVFDRTKRAGILASLVLMTVFTVYLIGMLTFSKNVPCSCGGILQQMTWTQHIFFNIGFIILAAIGLFMYTKKFEKWYSSRKIKNTAQTLPT